MTTVANPYETPGPYRRVQLHTHSRASIDGKWSVQELVGRYAELGFDFVFITDHDRVTRVHPSPPDVGARCPLVLPGEESTAVYPFWPLGRHMLRLFVTRSFGNLLGRPRPQELIDEAAEQGGFVVVSHPSWRGNLGAGVWPLPLLRELAGLRFIEVFNYHSNSQKDAETWDALLAERSSVDPLWAVAVDDAHHAGRAGCGWVEARVPEVSHSALRSALDCGSFYATTGLALDFGASQDAAGDWTVWTSRRAVRAEDRPGSTLYAPHDTPLQVRFVRGYGSETTCLLGPEPDEFISMPVTGDERYIRIEVAGDGRRAWSQPMWIAKGE